MLFEAFDMLERATALESDPLTDDAEAPAIAMAHINTPRRETPPEIVFPRDGVEVFLASAERGFSFAARGGAQDYRWYVDGEPLAAETTSRRIVWHPGQPGFYDVTVVDGEGRKATSKVRVRASG